MFLFYQFIFILIILISPVIILLRILKKKEHKKRFIEKFSLTGEKKNKGKKIWFHGSSVGEIMSVVPLIRYYENKKSIKKILVTSNTLSSSKVIQNLKLKKTVHQFYPIDYFYFVKRFLNFWQPSIAIFIDSEIWPCMFRELKNKKIPLLLLNARITKKSFGRWMKFKNFSSSIFKNITKAYPQNNETKNYLRKLNVNNNNFLGNLKFIENKLQNSQINRLNVKFKKYKTWVAASTHEGEELFCAKVHLKLKKKIKNLITIIIPRHINRANEIKSELEAINLKVSLHSDNFKKLNEIDIYLVDTFGESKNFYKISSTVFLGKSISVRGGQNPLEAMHHGARIIHGPFVDNFREIYKFLKTLKASKKIKNINQLASKITFKKDKISSKKIKKIGILIQKKTIKEINKFI